MHLVAKAPQHIRGTCIASRWLAERKHSGGCTTLLFQGKKKLHNNVFVRPQAQAAALKGNTETETFNQLEYTDTHQGLAHNTFTYPRKHLIRQEASVVREPAAARNDF